MPEKATIEKARKQARQGKAPSTQAGEFVKDEIHKIRKGKHGARSAKQAVAIGLSEARSAGVDIPENPRKKTASRKKSASGRKASSETSTARSRASLKALKKEPTSSVSPKNLSKFAKAAAKKRGVASRKASAAKAVRTKKAAASGRKRQTRAVS